MTFILGLVVGIALSIIVASFAVLYLDEKAQIE